MSQTPQPSNEVGEENHQKWVPVVGTSNIGLKSSVFTTKNKGKSKQHRHKTLTLLQYLKNIGLSNLHQVSLENQDPRSQMPFAVLHQSRSNSAESRDCPAPTLPQVDFFQFLNFPLRIFSEEVTLKYGKLCVCVCVLFFFNRGWNTTQVF